MKSTYHVFFTNLANPLKIDIILCLKSGAKNVGGIVDCLKVEQSKVSHALSSLRTCNIVDMKKEGKQRIYSLNKDTIVPMLKLIDKHSTKFCTHKCKGCSRLK